MRVLVVLTLVLAGCAAPAAPVEPAECAPVAAVLDTDVACLRGVAIIPADLVEVRAVDPFPTSWAAVTRLHVSQLPAAPEPDRLTENPGAGDRIGLKAHSRPGLEARFTTAAGMTGYMAQWLLVTPDNCTCPGGRRVVDLGERPAELPISFSVREAGRYEVVAALRPLDAPLDSPPVAFMIGGPHVLVGISWEIEGTVHPLRISGHDVWEQGTDIYRIQNSEHADRIEAAVHFRTTDAPAEGTDIDLGLVRSDGTLVACSRNPSQEPTPDPAQADEAAAATGAMLGPEAQIWIGAQMAACGASDYTNAAPVPYRLTVNLIVESVPTAGPMILT